MNNKKTVKKYAQLRSRYYQVFTNKIVTKDSIEKEIEKQLANKEITIDDVIIDIEFLEIDLKDLKSVPKKKKTI